MAVASLACSQTMLPTEADGAEDAHWQLSKTLVGHTDRVGSVALTPDGQTLASASWDGSVKLWDMDRTLTTEAGSADRIAFSPDGSILASTELFEGTTLLWDVSSGQLLARLEADDGYSGAGWSKLSSLPNAN
jgi:WD40 repeat protein